MPAPDLPERLRAALADRDRDAAVALATGGVDRGELTIPELYDLLAGHLVDVGAGWQHGETAVWEEHLATDTVRTIVDACEPAVARRAAPPLGRTVVLAAPPDEHHDVGMHMLAHRFRLAGWTAHVLGADVPVAELAAAVTALGAELVVVSVATHRLRVGLHRYVDELEDRCPGVRVLVGGAAFAHGHDGWPADRMLDPSALPGGV